ncbi:sigma-70 family RNA polymerase sigma factor [Mesorhizobium sp. M0207]|uniref:sigma-70 family RNA polymerase sigma factor n=1 Tax=Mesorhizobium sp. M0207 TaxID=2956915 RepID=UPI0033389F81
MTGSATGTPEGREPFDRLLGELRPKLHRYCARMTGSVIDAEDVVQEATVKALEAFPGTGPIANVEGWLFRIAHNAALDHLRRRARVDAAHAVEDIDTIPDPGISAEGRHTAAASLQTFMRLPAAQRGSVILMDVLGYTIEEIGNIIDCSVPAVKAALYRGRLRLRQVAGEPDDRPVPVLAEPERARLAAYVERFNARDFDTIRDMLAEDVRLDLVNRLRASGRTKVGRYFHNYAGIHDWRLLPGLVDRRPAILVIDPDDSAGGPKYLILLEWAGDRLSRIRDFRYARYTLDGAKVVPLLA